MRIGLPSTTCLGALAALALLAGPAVAATPTPVASWHGQPIRQPEPRPQAAVTGLVRSGASRPALRPGTGFQRAGGSVRVRALQRMLHHLGYQCGPVDGLYGPLTAASVRWFQIKHGFAPTGAADAGTLDFLRLRTTGATPASSTAGPAQPASPAPSPPAARPVAARAAVPPPAPHHGSVVKTVLLVLAGLAGALLLLAGWLLRRRRTRPSEEEAPPPVAPEPDGPLVVGYVVGSVKRELDHQAASIERACGEREWTLAGLVREGPDASQPGLAHALERVAGCPEARLVVARLEQVAPSATQLAILLAACAEHGVDLAAVEPELDTATPEGRLAARTLLGPVRPAIGRRRRMHRSAHVGAPEIGR